MDLALKDWFNIGFIVVLLSIFFVNYAAIFLGAEQSFYNTPLQVAEETYLHTSTLRETINFLDIFSNNLSVSIYLIIPVAGLLFFLVTLWNTGTIVGHLALITGVLPSLYILGISIPIAILEIFAYSLLGSEALYVFLLFIFKSGFKQRLINHSWKSLIMYVFVLFFAANMEALMILGQ